MQKFKDECTKYFRLLVLLNISLILSGCLSPGASVKSVEEKYLWGIWKATYNEIEIWEIGSNEHEYVNGIERLELKEDGTFTHSFHGFTNVYPFDLTKRGKRCEVSISKPITRQR